MNVKSIVCIVIYLFTIVAPIESIAMPDGNQFVRDCSVYKKFNNKTLELPDDRTEALMKMTHYSYCIGLVDGVMQTIASIGIENVLKDWKLCISGSLSREDIIDMTLSIIENNPRLVKEKTITIISMALLIHYRCEE